MSIGTRFGFNIQHERRERGREGRKEGKRKKGKGEVEGGRERKYENTNQKYTIHICDSNNQLSWEDWELEGSMDYI